MAKMLELVGNSKKQDILRYMKNERIPYRGKKKHGTQMTSREKAFLFQNLKAIKRWKLSSHALDRIEEKGIKMSYNDVVDSIDKSTIIEYHIAKCGDSEDKRVLLRSKSLENNGDNLHFVYSITRGVVISSWLNRAGDTHETLDWNAYDKNLKILHT